MLAFLGLTLSVGTLLIYVIGAVLGIAIVAVIMVHIRHSTKKQINKMKLWNPLPVLGDTQTMIYHFMDCKAIDKTPRERFVRFNTYQEAQAQGYTACKKCAP